MKTERLEISGSLYESGICRAAEILKGGGIVAIPTETVYGLAASAYCEDAVKKVFAAKGRPQDNPLIVHISDVDMINSVTDNFTEEAVKCAEAFWPGPFTMVLSRGKNIPKSVSAGLDTVAVRMPDHKTARDIIRKSGIPLAAPSANTSGAPSPTCAGHVLSDLDGKIDAVVMDGDCTVGVESTVVTLCTNPPKLLRPGGITLEQLREVLPDIEVDPAVLNEPLRDEKVASPGMKYKHYSPKTETFLVLGSKDNFVRFVNNKKDALAVCFDEEADFVNTEKICYGSQLKPESLAHNLFSVLRRVDGMDVSAVYVHAPEKSGMGLAVYNRLIRAAAFKVIEV